MTRNLTYSSLSDLLLLLLLFSFSVFSFDSTTGRFLGSRNELIFSVVVGFAVVAATAGVFVVVVVVVVVVEDDARSS